MRPSLHLARPLTGRVFLGLIVVWLTCAGSAEGQVQVSSVVNAASYASGNPLAPGTAVSIFGSGLATGTAVATSFPLPKVLGQTVVTVNGLAAPLYFVSPQQINVQLPYGLSGSSASVVVKVGGAASQAIAVTLATVTPGIFSLLANGSGPAALLHLDGGIVSRDAPLQAGETVSLYLTGLGEVAPSVESGAAAPGPPGLALVRSPVSVLFDGVEGRVGFTGLAPYFAGLYQINVTAPSVLLNPYPSIRVEAEGTVSNAVSAGGPGLLDVTPSSSPAAADAAVVVRGKNLTANTWLEVGGERLAGRFTAGDLDEFRTTIPARLLSTPGRVAITVLNTSGNLSNRSNSIDYTVTPVEPPVTSPYVYVIDSLRRVEIADVLPSTAVRSASVAAARNEYESFQIIVHGGQTGWQLVTAALKGALTGPQGASIPIGNVTFYRAGYLTVDNPSHAGEGGAKAGTYPDPLIPFINPFTGQPLTGGQYGSAPFDVAAAHNQTIYVEVFVPPGTPAGVYTGSISVTRYGNIKLADVPVSVTVWNFDLPKAPSLRSAFQAHDSDYAIGPAAYYGYTTGGAEHLSVATAMNEQLIAHRLMPESPHYIGFSVGSDGSISDPGSVVETYLLRPECSDYALPFDASYPFAHPLDRDRAKAIAYLRNAYAWFANRNLLGKVWLRQFDEPMTAAEFQSTRNFADLIHEANPNYKVAISGDFSQSGFPTYLYGHLDIYIMGIWNYDPTAAAQRQANQDDIWSYTALVQNSQNPSPFWEIDFPLLNHRVVPWIQYRYGLTGLQHWTTANWSELHARGQSPWTNPCSMLSDGLCFNGEGMLFYPGKEVNYVVPAGTYGKVSTAPVYGPIASLRLKALRDGMEDYELLVLAARKNPNAAMEAALQVACAGNRNLGDAVTNCFHAWNKDPDSLPKARAALALIITAGQ